MKFLTKVVLGLEVFEHFMIPKAFI